MTGSSLPLYKAEMVIAGQLCQKLLPCLEEASPVWFVHSFIHASIHAAKVHCILMAPQGRFYKLRMSQRAREQLLTGTGAWWGDKGVRTMRGKIETDRQEVAALGWMVREGPSEEVSFEQRPGGRERYPAGH